MIQQLKLLSTTAILTLLIWVGADQLLTVSNSVEVHLEFRGPTDASPMRITPIGPSSAIVMADVSGSQRLMNAIADQGSIRATVRLPDQPAQAVVKIDRLVDLLRQDQSLLGRLYVESTDPSAIEVQIDRRVVRPVRVEPRTPLQRTYEGEPLLAPKQVSAEVSELWLKSRPDPEAPIILPIDFERDLSNRKPGDDFDFPVAVPIEELGPGASVLPTSIRVQGRLRQDAQQVRTLQIVPIRVCMSFEDLGKPHRVKLADEFALPTQSIRVRGSRSDLDQLAARLDAGELAVYGVVRIKPDMFAEKREFSVVPDFFLPQGLSLDSIPEPMRLKVVTTDSDLKGDEAEKPEPASD